MRVMIVGASNDRRKFGNKAVRAYVRQGHSVLPVNPHEIEVEGLQCFATVGEVPHAVDRTLFYVPPTVGITIVDSLAVRGNFGHVWLNPGAESNELIAKFRSLGVEPILDCAIIDIGERP